METNIKKVTKLSIKFFLLGILVLFILYFLLVLYFIFVKSESSHIELWPSIKAKYFTINKKCEELSQSDVDILNNNFSKIGYSGSIDYWCDLGKIKFSQSIYSKDYMENKKIFIPNQITKLKNLYMISLINIKIDFENIDDLLELSNLYYICFDGTGLEKLPDNLTNLKKLRFLYISKDLYNNLSNNLLEKLKNKEIIDYSYFMSDYYN